MADKAKFFTIIGAEISHISGTDPVKVLNSDAENDRIVNQLLISTNDTSDHTAQLKLSNGSIDIVLGVVTIPDGSGTNGTNAAVDIVNSLSTVFTRVDNAGNKCFELPSGYSMYVKISGITSEKSYDVYVNYAR